MEGFQKYKSMEHCSKNSDLLGPDGKKMRAALWEVLTTELNCVGGPKKTSAKWQRVSFYCIHI